jgi:hypothetical protein
MEWQINHGLYMTNTAEGYKHLRRGSRLSITRGPSVVTVLSRRQCTTLDKPRTPPSAGFFISVISCQALGAF